MLAVFSILSLFLQATPSTSTTTPAPAAKPTVEQANAPHLLEAEAALTAHDPTKALAILTTALAAYDADLAGEKRRLYCGMSMQEAFLYMSMASRDKISAVALTLAIVRRCTSRVLP